MSHTKEKNRLYEAFNCDDVMVRGVGFILALRLTYVLCVHLSERYTCIFWKWLIII